MMPTSLTPTAPLALAALFLAASLPIHADELPADPKAGEETWTPLYKDTLDDFRIYFRGQGYIDDVHAQKVFLAEPGQIRVINGTAGLIVTKVPYSHYHVKVDYRWGEKGGSLNAGLMTHIDLKSKVVKDNRPRSIEINMRHDSPGSVWMAKGLGPFGSSFVKEGSGNFLAQKDGGVLRLIDPFKDRTVYGNYPDGKVNTNPHGEWNTLEAIVRGAESVEIIHNGYVVLRIHDIREADTATKQPGAPLVSGGIGLQSEGQEVFYRNFLIRNLEHDAEEGKPDGSIDDSHVFNDAHPRSANAVKPGDPTAIPPETVREWSTPFLPLSERLFSPSCAPTVKSNFLAILTTTLLAIASLSTVNAATLTWTGATGNNWFEATNWTPNQQPSNSSDDITINSGTPVASTNVNIGSGGSVTINGGDVAWSGRFNTVGNQSAGNFLITGGSLSVNYAGGQSHAFNIGNAGGAGVFRQQGGTVSALFSNDQMFIR